MKISGLRKESRGDQVALVADVESARFGTDIIWVSVPKEYESWLCTERYDGFLAALLYPAMAYHEAIEIEGVVSKRLLRNINRSIRHILLSYDKHLHPITVTVGEVSGEPIPSAAHTGTGFSGGVDSFSTIYDNYVNETDPAYRIDTLLCINVGMYGAYNVVTRRGYDDKEVFRRASAPLKQYADSVGLPFLTVDSNFHRYNDEWGFQRVFPLVLAAGVLSLQAGLVKYYLASAGLDYNMWIDTASTYRRYDMGGFGDPVIPHLLSTETTELISDGMQHTRIRKTLNIAEYLPTRQFLDVCGGDKRHKTNCGICSKCMRVGLTLDSVGKLEDYRDVFDIERFRKKRFSLKCEAVLLRRSDPFLRDLVDFGKAHGQRYPWWPIAFVRTLFSPSNTMKRFVAHRLLNETQYDKALTIYKKLRYGYRRKGK